MPLVVVPFKSITGDKLATQRKQAAKARRIHTLIDAQAMLCTAPGRLGRVEVKKRESSAAGTAQSEEEGKEGALSYVPNWPQVTIESNFSTADKKMEWLLNCLHPIALEGYNMLGAGLMIGLGVQSALLVSARCKDKEK